MKGYKTILNLLKKGKSITKRYLLLVISSIKFLIIFIPFFIACSNTANKKENNSSEVSKQLVNVEPMNQITNAGWEFVKSRLLSPSSAKLISSKYGAEVKQILEKKCSNSDALLPDCITVGYFEYDAQNGFGALIRESAFVFYKNGNPCYMETASAINDALNELTRMGIPQNFIPTINAALEINNCGCE